jgi:alpha-tubulin suppressor-like RCC1 family protein
LLLYWRFFLFKLFLFLFYFFINKLENKNLYCCGNNASNQKGIYYGEKKLKIPTKIDFFKNIEIENIFTGYSSTFIKTKSY